MGVGGVKGKSIECAPLLPANFGSEIMGSGQDSGNSSKKQKKMLDTGLDMELG